VRGWGRRVFFYPAGLDALNNCLWIDRIEPLQKRCLLANILHIVGF